MAPKKKQRRRRRRRVGLPRANRAADLSQSMGIPPTVRTVQGAGEDVSGDVGSGEGGHIRWTPTFAL